MLTLSATILGKVLVNVDMLRPSISVLKVLVSYDGRFGASIQFANKEKTKNPVQLDIPNGTVKVVIPGVLRIWGWWKL